MTNHVLISTLQKSGTWYIKYALWVYYQMLNYPEKEIDLKDSQAISNELKHNVVRNIINFGDKRLYLGHSICPGINDLDTEMAKKWKEMTFWTEGYNWTEKDLFDGDTTNINPIKNKHAKIVYIQRNPIDHFVSFHNHCKNHKFPDHYECGQMDLKTFVFKRSALEGYIKHTSSFKLMKDLYPDNILIINFETLIRYPVFTLNRIFYFVGLPNFEKKFSLLNFKNLSKLSKIIAKDKLKELEIYLGRSLANDQKIASESHIRNMKSRYGKNLFSDEEIRLIHKAINSFYN